MDDILELLPKLIDPIVRHIDKNLATALAIIGALVAFFVQRREKQKRKRRDEEHKRRDEEMRGMLLVLLSERGISWDAENVDWKESMAKMPSKHLWPMASLARFVTWFIRKMEIDQYISRSGNDVKNINWTSLTVALLGALKMVLQAFGIDIITDDQINAIANGVAALAAVVGVIMSHRKGEKKVEEHKADTGAAL